MKQSFCDVCGKKVGDWRGQDSADWGDWRLSLRIEDARLTTAEAMEPDICKKCYLAAVAYLAKELR